MASFSERISRAILGDPLEAGLLPKPIAYEDVHNDVQSILIPPMYPKGINVHYLQSIKKSFALQHRYVPLFHSFYVLAVVSIGSLAGQDGFLSMTIVCPFLAAWD